MRITHANVLAFFLAVGAIVGCGQAAINRANHLKDEGNAASVAGDKLVDEVKEKFESLFTTASISGFPGNREENAEIARETKEKYATAIEQYRLGAAKFAEASKQDIDSDVAEYFAVWNQILEKSAKQREIGARYVQLWLDEEVDTNEKLRQRMTEIESEFDAVDAEVDALLAKAKQIENDKADKLD